MDSAAVAKLEGSWDFKLRGFKLSVFSTDGTFETEGTTFKLSALFTTPLNRTRGRTLSEGHLHRLTSASQFPRVPGFLN